MIGKLVLKLSFAPGQSMGKTLHRTITLQLMRVAAVRAHTTPENLFVTGLNLCAAFFPAQ